MTQEVSTPAALQAAYEIVEALEGGPEDSELPAELAESVQEKLSLVGKGELLRQLREAEEATSGLMEMGMALSPAMYAIFRCAHFRAAEALRRAQTYLN